MRRHPVSGERPNLLFIMTDHQRADSLGAVQAGVEVTPHLNRLASEGTVFTRAYNTCPLCVPARTALATGKYPTKTGVIHNDWRGVTAGNHRPIHQCLAEAACEVGHLGVNHVRVKPVLKERVPFSVFLDKTDYIAHLRANGLEEMHRECLDALRTHILVRHGGETIRQEYSWTPTAVWPAGSEHFLDNFFADRAVTFLRAERIRPFALFVCLWAPHPPLAVPEPYATMFDPAKIDLPENVGLAAEGEPADRRTGDAALLAEGVSMNEWRKVWAAHLGLVRLADDALGRMLATLEAEGHADDTTIVFTSDHGDHLGQHAMYQKMEMYEQAIRVPLVFRAPGGSAGSFDTPVSHLDVMPTTLELMGLDVPDDLDGDSLAESVLSATPPAEKHVFSMYAGNHRIGSHRRAAVTGRWKYVYDPADVAELYDLETDPLEMHNLSAETRHAGTVRELHAACRAWHESRGDRIRF